MGVTAKKQSALHRQKIILKQPVYASQDANVLSAGPCALKVAGRAEILQKLRPKVLQIFVP